MKFLQQELIFVLFSALLLAFAPQSLGGQTGQALSPDAPNVRRIGKENNRWFFRGRLVRGQSATAMRYRAYLKKMQMRTVRPAVPPTITEDWIPLGPAPLKSDASGSGLQDYNFVSGRATSVAIDPADPGGNTVYVGGAYGGVWKSTNAGPASNSPDDVTWTPLTDGQATLAVGSIAIQPQLTNPDPGKSVILVGTGETDNSTDSYYGLGILRSLNAGGSWTLITQDTTGAHSFAGLGFSKIAFSSVSPNLVVAGAGAAAEGIAEGLESPIAVNRGIYFSSDSGASWTYASVTDGAGATDPSSATSVAYNAVAGTFFAALSSHGFYSSTDAIHWTRLPNQPGLGLSTTACPSHSITQNSCPLYRGEISVVPGRNEMYVWYVDANDADGGIWRSSNGGASWIQISDAGITNCGDPFGGCATSQGSYNLALTAVADGSVTDLYAGAVNLYKCRITSASPTCTGTRQDTFQNLTHVYGCSSIARMHPNQHGIASLLVNNNAQDILYFANDGGIYRALDGYSNFGGGDCGDSNRFDSLNQTLGSITQMVSLSQSPTDPNLVIGGAGDNGIAATATAQGNSMWMNVNAGSGGTTAISAADEDAWLVSTPPDSVSGVNIFECASGIGCHTGDFVNHQVVSGATVGGDTGGFYLPFQFDPQNAGELLVGTCRVWRGTADGTGFELLSNNFETGGDAICSGNETNLVRSMAAGGALDINNLSNVIYAGTDGFGPNLVTSPTGGHVWVSTNVTGGSLTWTDQTHDINPGNFPISAIAIDSSDVSGLTAYATIMGFHVSHVWKTIDGGATWTDFTANLPDAPVNAIVVDAGVSPATGTIYVGTDVGVFASNTSTADWSEVGPDAGQARFLPNVAVTALRIFDHSSTKRLRASTYGRGIWELNLITTPDFQMSVLQNPVIAFAGNPAVFTGNVSALNGFSSSVALTCASGTTIAPQNCLVAPRSLAPANSGTSIAVTASGIPGDYLFNLHGAATDPNAVMHDLALTLSVIDFGLTVPSLSNIAVTPPNDTAPVTFQATAAGSFKGTVNLSCLGLPDGGACNFSPATMNPTANNPIDVTLTIRTSVNIPRGPFSIMIVGTTPGGPNRVQAFTLLVNAAANPDYALTVSNPALNAPANTSAIFHGTLTAVNGYGSIVNLSCGAGSPPSCVAIPSIATPSPSGEPFTVTVSSVSIHDYSFNLVAQGTDASAISHATPVSFNSGTGASSDFSIANTSVPQDVVAGTSAQYVLTFTASGGGAFANSVSYTCSSSLVPLSGCSFNTASPIAAGISASQITLTVSTTAAIASLRRSSAAFQYALWLPLMGLFFVSGKIRRPRQLFLSIMVFLILLMCSCGGGLRGGTGGGEPGTPAGEYSVTVNASEGSVSHSLQLALTVR